MILTPSVVRQMIAEQGVRGYAGWTDPEIEAAVERAQEWAAQVSGREFETIAATRYFTGNGTETLWLPDFLAVETVTVGTAELAATAYQALPLNGERKTRLRRTGGGYWPVPTDPGNVAVEATWGYAAEVPARVKQAVFLAALVSGQTGNVVPLPGSGGFQSVSAFSISFTRAGAADAVKSAAAVLEDARTNLAGYIDVTARAARANNAGG